MSQKSGVAVLLFAVMLCSAPIPGAFWVRRQLQHRLDIKIEGNFIPMPFVPVFYLKDAHFEWRGRLRFENGDLKVCYNPFSFFAGRGIRIQLKGKKLDVRLLGDWAKMQGVEQASIEKLEADFSLGKKGLSEIYSVDVQSKAFQFRLKKSENNSKS